MRKLLLFVGLSIAHYASFSQSIKIAIDGDTLRASGNGPHIWYQFFEPCKGYSDEGSCNADLECVWLESICVPNTIGDNACNLESSEAGCNQLNQVGCSWSGSACEKSPDAVHQSLGTKDNEVGFLNSDVYMIKGGDNNWAVFKPDTLASITRSTLNPEICPGESYTVPSTHETYAVSGTYYDTIANSAGCDSIMRIDLVIKDVDTSVTNNSPTITANTSGAAYQWLDCNDNYNSISSETGQSYTAVVSGDYAVEITENGCTDTSYCSSVVILGLESNFTNQFNLYPNPSEGLVKVDFDALQSTIVMKTYSITGQLIDSRSYKDVQSIDVNFQAPSGIYFIELANSDGQTAVVRLMKE